MKMVLYIVDRTKDMIVTGGFNVFPREMKMLFQRMARLHRWHHWCAQNSGAKR